MTGWIEEKQMECEKIHSSKSGTEARKASGMEKLQILDSTSKTIRTSGWSSLSQAIFEEKTTQLQAAIKKIANRATKQNKHATTAQTPSQEWPDTVGWSIGPIQ